MTENGISFKIPTMDIQSKEQLIAEKDLPLHCPTAEQALWNMHPCVFLDIEEKGEAKCPYCGEEFRLEKKSDLK